MTAAAIFGEGSAGSSDVLLCCMGGASVHDCGGDLARVGMVAFLSGQGLCRVSVADKGAVMCNNYTHGSLCVKYFWIKCALRRRNKWRKKTSKGAQSSFIRGIILLKGRILLKTARKGHLRTD